MVQISAFRALRPSPEKAAELVCVPYDVVERDEARAIAADKDASFMRIIRPDLEFPDSVNPYGDEVYAKGRTNLQGFRDRKWLVRDDEPSLYVYRLNVGDHQQTGLVAGSGISDYENDVVKKHEFTRPDKEKDRTTHIDVLGANTGPVFLMFQSKENREIARKIDAYADSNEPLYDLSFDDGVRHRIYRIGDPGLRDGLVKDFGSLNASYIADGHHRAASAFKNGDKRRKEQGAGSGTEPYHFFLSVIFPDDQLAILPYNRAVKDLNGLTPADLIARIESRFQIESGKFENPGIHQINMFLDNQWYRLIPKQACYKDADEIHSLDVSILQNEILGPHLGIDDPRTSDRIKFVGGIKGDGFLEQLVQRAQFMVAFAMPPVTPAQLIAVADAGKVMPPKSTWFEPKLRSGFLTHLLDEQ